MKRKLVALVIVVLIASFVPAAAAAKQQNNWSTTQKIVYVGLTPKDQPDFWTGSSGETTVQVHVCAELVNGVQRRITSARSRLCIAPFASRA